MFCRAALLVPLVLSVACSSGGSGSGGTSSAGTTYWRNVKPILEARCEGCHSANGIGSFDLTTYAQAKAMAPAIAASVQAGSMPPWMPSDEGLALRHERRLTAQEIATIDAWISEGTREGDPATKPASGTGDIETLAPSAELSMQAPYTPNLATGSDDYRCFVLDPKLGFDTAVTAFDIRPGNTRIVHHVILFSVAPGKLGELATEEARDAAPGYTCFGDANVQATMVGAWVPGITATRFPAGTGVVLKANSRLVMQVHYNTLLEQNTTDQTTALLEYAPASDVKPAYIFPVLNNTFEVAPGEKKTVTATYDTDIIYDRLPAGLDVTFHGLAPHMHLHGASISVKVLAGDQTTTLIDIPKWDFHWQQFYFFDEAYKVPRGTTVELSCSFDNSPEAQPVINGQPTTPSTLRWGEGTLEEMCLNFFYATL
jgi:hypothetical protein